MGILGKTPSEWDFPRQMWQRLLDMMHYVGTAADLGPDFQVRQQISQLLRDRRSLSLDEWFDSFWHHRGISKPLVTFIYIHLEKYSGLKVAKFRPNDHLEHDLKLTMVCWFDWHLTFCEDFCQCFGVDLSDRLDPRDFCTLEELVIFLNCQLLTTV